MSSDGLKHVETNETHALCRRHVKRRLRALGGKTPGRHWGHAMWSRSVPGLQCSDQWQRVPTRTWEPRVCNMSIMGGLTTSRDCPTPRESPILICASTGASNTALFRACHGFLSGGVRHYPKWNYLRGFRACNHGPPGQPQAHSRGEG